MKYILVYKLNTIYKMKNICFVISFQRYFTTTNYFKSGGPVFLMIGGEGAASPVWMTNGAWLDYANTYSALCFQLEHRYYGESHPTR